jgi:hypothetical protein
MIFLILMCSSAYADSFSFLSDEINSNLRTANEANSACEQKTDSFPFTRIGMSIGTPISFGIHEVLNLAITPEIGFIWVKKGHEPD